MLRDEIADRGPALGGPRPVVEKTRGLQERGYIELNDADAHALQQFDRALERRFRPLVAEEFQAIAARNADLQGRRRFRERAEPDRTRIRVGLVRPGHDRERVKSIVRGQRKDRNAVERAAGRNDAGRGHQPEARLQADNIVEPGRHAAGAGCIRAERQRHEAGGYRDSRSRARSAGDERRIERIARYAIGRAHADKAGGELIEIGLADDDRARPRASARRRWHRLSANRKKPGRRRWSEIPPRRYCP